MSVRAVCGRREVGDWLRSRADLYGAMVIKSEGGVGTRSMYGADPFSGNVVVAESNGWWAGCEAWTSAMAPRLCS